MTIWPFDPQRAAPKQIAVCETIASPCPHHLTSPSGDPPRDNCRVCNCLDCPIAVAGRLSVRLLRMRGGAVFLTAHASGWGPMLRVAIGRIDREHRQRLAR